MKKNYRIIAALAASMVMLCGCGKEAATTEQQQKHQQRLQPTRQLSQQQMQLRKELPEVSMYQGLKP